MNIRSIVNSIVRGKTEVTITETKSIDIITVHTNQLNVLYDVRGDLIVEKILAKFWHRRRLFEKLTQTLIDLNLVIAAMEKQQNEMRPSR